MPEHAYLHAIDKLLDSSPHTANTVDEICHLMFDVVVNQPRVAFGLLDRIETIIDEIDYERGRGLHAGIKGYAYFMVSDFERALPLLLETLPAFTSEDEPELFVRIHLGLANIYVSIGMYTESLNHANIALETARHIENLSGIGWSLRSLGDVHQVVGNNREALKTFEEALRVFEAIPEPQENDEIVGRARALSGIGTAHQRLGDLEQGLSYHQRALEIYRSVNNESGESRALTDIAICLTPSRPHDALKMHEDSLQLRISMGNRQAQCTSLIHIADLLLGMGDSDAALVRSQACLETAIKINSKPRVYQAHEVLSRIYEARGDWQAALKHLKEYYRVYGEVIGDEVHSKISNIQITKKAETARKDAEIARLKAEALDIKNVELRNLLDELRKTQQQLVQSEKLASLGQLTAGIAHEIKNPLNFILNFAALNYEMSDELVECLASDRDDASDELVKELVDGIKMNTVKIEEHSKRADRIVRGMLEHARTSSTRRAPIDLNRLLREYAALAYHGMRATEPELNIDIKFRIADDIGEIVGSEQDLGRVILNIVNNACYAILHRDRQSGTPGHDRITIVAERNPEGVEILVRDTGGGIPADILDKVFNPFFTTKPAGAGTGLGLSLSHDIVVSHGGAMMAENDAEGATIKIQLPVA